MPRPIARTAALAAAGWRASRHGRHLVLRMFLWTVGLALGGAVGWFALSLVSAAPAVAAEASGPALELSPSKPFHADGDGTDGGGGGTDASGGGVSGGGDSGDVNAEAAPPAADNSGSGASSDPGPAAGGGNIDPGGGDTSGPGPSFDGGPGGGIGGIDGNGSTSDGCGSCSAGASGGDYSGGGVGTGTTDTVGTGLNPGGGGDGTFGGSSDSPPTGGNGFSDSPAGGNGFSDIPASGPDLTYGSPDAAQSWSGNSSVDQRDAGSGMASADVLSGGLTGDLSSQPNDNYLQSGLTPDRNQSIDALATVGQQDQFAADSGSTDQANATRGPPTGTAQWGNGVTSGQDGQGNPVITEPPDANGNVTTYTANGTMTYAPGGAVTHQALETSNLPLPDGSYANGQQLPSGSAARVFDNVDTVSTPPDPSTGASTHTENDQVQALVSTDPSNDVYTPVHTAQVSGTVTAPGLSAPVAADDQMPRGDFLTADGYQIGANVGGQQPGAPTISAAPGVDSTSAAQGNPTLAAVANAPGLEQLPDQQAILPNGYGTGESTAPVNYGQALYATDSLTGLTQAPPAASTGPPANNPMAPGGPFLQQGPDAGDHAGNPVWGQVLGSPSVVDQLDPVNHDPLVAEQNQTSVQQLQSSADGLAMTTNAAMNAYANPAKDAATEAITGGQPLTPAELNQSNAVLRQTQTSGADATGKLMVGYDTAVQAAAPNDPATNALNQSVNTWLADPTNANMSAVNDAANPIVNGWQDRSRGCSRVTRGRTTRRTVCCRQRSGKTYSQMRTVRHIRSTPLATPSRRIQPTRKATSPRPQLTPTTTSSPTIPTAQSPTRPRRPTTWQCPTGPLLPTANLCQQAARNAWS